jgi:hypothetical protein
LVTWVGLLISIYQLIEVAHGTLAINIEISRNNSFFQFCSMHCNDLISVCLAHFVLLSFLIELCELLILAPVDCVVLVGSPRYDNLPVSIHGIIGLLPLSSDAK